MISSKQTGKGKDSLSPADPDVEALARAEHADPFSVLGPHGMARAGSLFGHFCRAR